MSGQPPEIFGQLVSLLVIIFFSFYFFCGFLNPEKYKAKPPSPKDWDMVNLGIVEYPVEKTPKKQPTVKTVHRNTKPVKQANPLFDDCVDALVGLGAKKRVAVDTATKIFASNTINSVQQFITIAFKK